MIAVPFFTLTVHTFPFFCPTTGRQHLSWIDAMSETEWSTQEKCKAMISSSVSSGSCRSEPKSSSQRNKHILAHIYRQTRTENTFRVPIWNYICRLYVCLVCLRYCRCLCISNLTWPVSSCIYSSVSRPLVIIERTSLSVENTHRAQLVGCEV